MSDNASNMPDPAPTTQDRLSQGAVDIYNASARLRAFMALINGRQLLPDEAQALRDLFETFNELIETLQSISH